MNIFGGGAIIQPTTAEMEGATRPTMSLYALSSLPQPGEVVLRGRWPGPGPMFGEWQVPPASSLSGRDENEGQT